MLLLLFGCAGGETPTGPPLEPRPVLQTCLPDVSEGMPERLWDTGCFDDLKTLTPGPDLIPYDVSSALWTDGAFKPRYMVVPSSDRVTVREDGSWAFPEGSVLIKVFGFDFEVDGEMVFRPVETRFMVRGPAGWEYATYRWNADGTDAELLAEGARFELTIEQGGQSVAIEYSIPDEESCTTCHGAAIDDVLGLKTGQLNRERNYDGVVANQLRAMNDIGLLDFGDALEDGALDPARLPSMANPQQGNGDIEEQARAYLDANCAHCHRPGGWAPPDVGLDLRYETLLESTGLCEPMKYFRWVGTPRVAPGNPDGSGLLERFSRQDELRMPSLGTSVVDSKGEAVLRRWIGQLATCP